MNHFYFNPFKKYPVTSTNHKLSSELNIRFATLEWLKQYEMHTDWKNNG